MKSAHLAGLLLAALPALAACKNEVEEAVRKNLADGSAAEFEYVERCAGDSKIYYGRVKATHAREALAGSESFFYGGGEVAFAGSPSFTRLMKWCYDDRGLAAEAAAKPGPRHGT